MSLPGSPSSPSLYWNLCQRVEHGKLSPFEFWQWRLMTFDRCYNRSAILRNPRYASGWWKYWEIWHSKTRLSTHLPVRIMKGKVGYSIICVQRQRTGSGAIWYNFFLVTDCIFDAYNMSEGQRLASLPQKRKHRKRESLPGRNWGPPPWKREIATSIFFMMQIQLYFILF